MDLNLTKELTDSMRRIGFEEASISKVMEDDRYLESVDQPEQIQRSLLTMLFFDLTMYKAEALPDPIRIAMNAGTTPRYWLEDMMSTVLPFLKVNEDKFF